MMEGNGKILISALVAKGKADVIELQHTNNLHASQDPKSGSVLTSAELCSIT
jgi:hypothetical protein